MKNVYALQVSHIGGKNTRTLAIVLPARIVKKYQIKISTIFTIKGNDKTNIVNLHSLRKLGDL